jgi:oligopeptide transport system ATP-binding protein
MTPEESEVILEVKGLKAFYTSKKGIVRAVNDVSFDVRKGEALGIFGESGAGKTSIALAILGLFEEISRQHASTGANEENKRLWALRDEAREKGITSEEMGVELPGVEGQILFKGKDLSKVKGKEMREIRGDRITYVPQGTTKSLNPYSNIAEQTAESLWAHDEDGDLSERQVLHRVVKALDLVELGDALLRKGMKPSQFSVGEDQRVLIAMALITLPDLMIADEPTTALDMAIQNRILEAIQIARDQLGLGLLLISNNQATINATCDRVAVMTAGKIVELGSTDEVLGSPSHPFTRAFIMSNPSMETIRKIREKGLRIRGIPGAPPDLTIPLVGCPFKDRCEYAIEKCRKEEPDFREIKHDHFVMCHRYEELPEW